MKKLLILLPLLLCLGGCKNPLGTKNEDRSGFDDGHTTSPGDNPGNESPTISDLANLTVREDSITSGLAVTITDSDSALTCTGSLVASSSDTSIIDQTEIEISGTVPNCFLELTPKANQNGSANISLTVSDGSLTAADTFTLTVSPTFDPDEVLNLQAWFDASHSASLYQFGDCTVPAVLTLDPVGCWADRSGNSKEATMPLNTSYRPSLNLTQNSSSIEFDGVNDHFTNTHTYTAREVFIVYRPDSILQNTSHLGQLWGQYNRGHVSVDARSTGLWSFDGNAGAQAKYSTAGLNLSGATTGIPSTYAWSYNSFDIVRTRFESDISTTRQYMGTLDTENFAIGVHQFGGQISEILIYSVSLSATEAQKVEGYLACKWSLQSKLPGGHPYKASCP